MDFEKWLADIRHWRDERKVRIGYEDSQYNRPELAWARNSFIQALAIVEDRYFYDPLKRQYTVDKYLDDLDQRYGRIDSVVIWPVYQISASTAATSTIYPRPARFQTRQYTRAASLTVRCIALQETSVPQDGAALGRQIGNLASVYQAERDCAAAEELYRKAFALFEASLGPPRPEMAYILNNLGCLRMYAGKHQEAVPYIERAVAIWKSSFGASHPIYAQGLGNLAYLYGVAGRAAESEDLWKRACPWLKRRWGTNIGHTVCY